MRLTACIDTNEVYGLLQLPPELEEALRSGELVLRSNDEDGSVVVCTASRTFGIRRLNQSNTLFLGEPDTGKNELSILAAPRSMLEPSLGRGSIDWSKVPRYDPGGCTGEPMTITDLKENSMCSNQEFEEIFRAKPGCILDDNVGHVCWLNPDVVHSTLVELVSAMVEVGGDTALTTMTEEDAIKLAHGELSLLASVYRKFSHETSQGLDSIALARWTGQYLLQQRHPQEVNLDAFQHDWVQDLPVKHKSKDAVDWSLLEGCLVETRPGYGKYLDATQLSHQPRERFKELFRYKSRWKLVEIAPFLRDLVPPTAKIEAWVLKFARRSQEKGEYYVSARKL